MKTLESVFGRCYRFEFVPKGFMGRLIVRLLAFPMEARLYWRHGLLTQIGREKVLIELVKDQDMLLKILVRTELKGERMSNLSWLVFAAVDALVKEWYNLNAKVLVPCSHCLKHYPKDKPFMFPLEKCQQAATTPGESILFCPNRPSPFPSDLSVLDSMPSLFRDRGPQTRSVRPCGTRLGNGKPRSAEDQLGRASHGGAAYC